MKTEYKIKTFILPPFYRDGQRALEMKLLEKSKSWKSYRIIDHICELWTTSKFDSKYIKKTKEDVLKRNNLNEEDIEEYIERDFIDDYLE